MRARKAHELQGVLCQLRKGSSPRGNGSLLPARAQLNPADPHSHGSRLRLTAAGATSDTRLCVIQRGTDVGLIFSKEGSKGNQKCKYSANQQHILQNPFSRFGKEKFEKEQNSQKTLPLNRNYSIMLCRFFSLNRTALIFFLKASCIYYPISYEFNILKNLKHTHSNYG